MFTTDAQLNTSACNSSRYGAWAFFAMPFCYLAMFVIFGLVLSFPQSNSVGDKIAYITEHGDYISLGYLIGYLVFGCLLLLAVQAVQQKLNKKPSALLDYATAFGMIWVVLMMCSGMIAIVGLNTMTKLYSQGSAHAETLFFVYTSVTNGLGGGVEFVGAMWVLMLSIHGFKSLQFSKGLNLFGLIVGSVGVLTLYQAIPEFKDAFGLLQVVWFIWMGMTITKLQQPK